MIDYYEVKSQPITIGKSMMFKYIRDETRRAVCPLASGSSTVPWERRGETPLRDPISGNCINFNYKPIRQV
jgi:hypothetical protein